MVYNYLSLLHYARQHYRITLAVGWLLLLGSVYLTLALTDLDVAKIALGTLTLLTTQWWGLPAVLITHLARPLLLLPISVFSVMSGVIFGFWIGVLVAFAGTLISGTIGYVVGRWFGRSLTYTRILPDQPRWLTRRPFELVLGLHLSMLPFDLINYTVGVMRVGFPSFLLGMSIGMIPGTISLTALGASLDVATIVTDGVSIDVFDVRYLALSIVVFLLSTAGAMLYRRWQAGSLGS